MHKTIKEITGQGFRKLGSNCIKSKDGKMLFNEDVIMSRWEEYVSELYNDDRGDPPEIEDEVGEEVLISEIENWIKDLKSGKASGSDMITSEMIKALNETGVKIIYKLVNDFYKTGVIPTSMNESIFLRLPMKSKVTMCTEYRTLSLMSHVLKVILKVILLRNKQKIESEISPAKWLYVRKRNPRGNLQHENVM